MLTLNHVSKTFNQGTVNENKVLEDLSLTLNDGDFVTMIGGNGAGKSTILNLIAGVYPADSGTVILDDINLTKLPEYRRAEYIGRVFQDPMKGTAADMEIEENLAMANRRGKTRSLRWSITDEERTMFHNELQDFDLGLENRLHDKVGLLSGGQRQALTLLMASFQNPKLLLLDEHTAALDPKTAKKVLNLTERIIDRSNLTALMVTHNMRDAIAYGNRLIMMYEGKIIFDVCKEEKKKLTVEYLLKKFEEASGEEFADDKALLSK